MDDEDDIGADAIEAVGSLFTDRMRKVLGRAYREAVQRGDQEIGPGHMLVALVVVRLGNAYRALKQEGLTVALARKALARLAGPGKGTADESRIGFSPSGLAVLVDMEVLSHDLDQDEIDTSHLLIALLDEKAGEAARMLEFLGVPPGRVRSATFRILQHQGSLSGSSLDYHLRTLLGRLEGDAIADLLLRAKLAHRTAFKAGEWERSARIVAAVTEISLRAALPRGEPWVPYARRRLGAVLPPLEDDLPDCWPPGPGA